MPRIPIATYRLQLHAGFGFDAAAAIADYLHQLGISHVYTSPYLQAAPGSQHGYDVVDYHKVNEELGGGEAHERFSKQLGACHLGQVLDIVPNHMAISGRRNRYWWDVLENGPSSRYAAYFDIDWQWHAEQLRNKLLVPILGDHYGRVLSRGEIKIVRQGGEFLLRYFDHELPIAPKSLPVILSPAAAQSGSDYLAFLGDSLSRLPDSSSKSRAGLVERHRDKQVIANLLDRLFQEVPFIAEMVDAVVANLTSDVNALDDFLERQNYRLAYWRTSGQELGYRRFFDVNTLVGLRSESEQVFADTHALILRWLAEGVLDGIRIDHSDGLRDPREYFERLRQHAENVWILAEKILASDEPLSRAWPINGTTGYDYLNRASGLFVDTTNDDEFTDIYSWFTAESTDYEAICRDKKHLVMRDLLGSDVNRLSSLFSEVCDSHRDQRDYTRHDIAHAIREVIACLPVYRTYVIPHRNEVSPEDERYITEAVTSSKRNRPDIDPALFDFLADVLTLRLRGTMESEFVLRFQQSTGAVMAKGVEDTAFYCFNRFISLNEVGGNPGSFGISPQAFHDSCMQVQQSHPQTMLASSTHDTKRSEDVRARLNVLSEIPAQWRAAVERWSNLNEKYKKQGAPDRDTEYSLYQTMVGAWPIETDRLLPYMEKACREAKRETSWHAPNEEFERATREFIEAIYRDPYFRSDFEAFVQPLIQPGRINSLSQTLLKLTSPGIPDTYQGCELWDLSLVDPDNRRPVDYDLRRRLLAELPGLPIDDILRRSDEGLPKLWTIHQALRTRRERPSAFDHTASYRPLCANGAKADHVVAYTRSDEVAVIVPRLIVKLAGDWGDTSIDLPPGKWRNQLSNGALAGPKVQLQEVLTPFPMALLTRESAHASHQSARKKSK